MAAPSPARRAGHRARPPRRWGPLAGSVAGVVVTLVVGLAVGLVATLTSGGGTAVAPEGRAAHRNLPSASPAPSAAPSPAPSSVPSSVPSAGTDRGPTPTAAGSTTPAESTASSSAAARTTFAVVGDSITAGVLPLEGATVRGSNSWIPAAQRNPRVQFVGGWAVPGATTAEMRTAVQPTGAEVVVVLAGTNDLATAATWPQIEANLLEIVATAGAPAVLLSAVPPRDSVPEATQQLNANLEQLALARGWTFVDPWADMASDGTWMAETSDDGIHPREDVAALVGDRLAAAIAATG